jgi:endoglucanase
MRAIRPVLAGLLLVVAVPLLGTGPPAAADTGELVVNGTFSDGMASWWNGPNTTAGVVGGALAVAVAGGTVNPWDAPIGQDNIQVTSGTQYTLSFDAAASTGASVRATVQLGQSPYTAPLDQTIALTTATRHYSFPFSSSLATTQGQVTFQLGGQASGWTFTVDNVSLRPTLPDFYVDPDSNAANWVRANPNDSRAATIEANIASRPGARWFGNWSGDIGTAVSSYVGAAAAAGRTPILVAYNIPGRDCGGASSGGAGSPDGYRTWISAFASAIGGRSAVVIVEPDAVAQLDCLPDDTERQTRLDLLSYATQQFHDAAPNAWVYLDGGNAGWIPAATMATRLDSAGVRNVRGFAVNVSNFYTTAESETYGTAIVSALGYPAGFVVDTSRNGNGSNGEWCNPAGRKLGTSSAYGTGAAELLLWVKVPGDSDGPCGTAPATPAGQFDPDLAVRLINGN